MKLCWCVWFSIFLKLEEIQRIDSESLKYSPGVWSVSKLMLGCNDSFSHFTVVKNLTANYRRCEFNPWVGKLPWRRKWQPAPVFLPGESLGERSLVGYSAALNMPANLENSAVAKGLGKGQFSFQSQRKAMPKNAQTTTQLHSFHMLVK